MKFVIFALLFATATVAVYGASVGALFGGVIPVGGVTQALDVAGLGGTLGGLLGGLLNNILGSLSGVLGLINISEITQTITDLANELTGTIIGSLLQTVANTLSVSNLQALIDATLAAVNNIISGGANAASLGSLHSVLRGLLDVVQGILDAFTPVLNFVGFTAGSIVIPQAVVPLLQAILNLYDNIGAAIHQIRDYVFSVVNTIISSNPTLAALLGADVSDLEQFIVANCPWMILRGIIASIIDGANDGGVQ